MWVQGGGTARAHKGEPTLSQPTSSHPDYEAGDTSLIYRTENDGTDAFDLQIGDRFEANANWSGRLIYDGAGTWVLTNTQGGNLQPLAKTHHGSIGEALAFFAGLVNASNRHR